MFSLPLDAERAAKLRRLAQHARLDNTTLARSMLSAAIDKADLDTHTATQVLAGIQDLPAKLEIAEQQHADGEVIGLDDL